MKLPLGIRSDIDTNIKYIVDSDNEVVVYDISEKDAMKLVSSVNLHSELVAELAKATRYLEVLNSHGYLHYASSKIEELNSALKRYM